MSIGERIRVIRGERSQLEFANELRIHRKTLIAYENGDRSIKEPPLRILIKSGINSYWLFTGEGHMYGGDQSTTPALQQLLQLAIRIELENFNAHREPGAGT